MLLELELDGNSTGISGIVMSDPYANPLYFEYYDGNSGGGRMSSDEITDGCDLPESAGIGYIYLTSDNKVLFRSPTDIGGWQFEVGGGAMINDIFGGETEISGFTTTIADSMAIAFSLSGSSIPAGCGTLTELDLDGETTGLCDENCLGESAAGLNDGIVISDPNGILIYFEIFEVINGCMDVAACNYVLMVYCNGHTNIIINIPIKLVWTSVYRQFKSSLLQLYNLVPILVYNNQLIELQRNVL